MVRFSSPDSDISRPDPVVLPAIAVLTFIVISIVWIAKVGASLEAIRNYAPSSAEFSWVLQWITKTGKPTVVRASVAKGFGLATADIPVVERGFRAEGERLTHVCAVGAGLAFEHLVFFSTVDETDGSATVWQSNNNGALISTVLFDGKIVEKVPNSRFNAEFRSELDYFKKKARSANLQRDTQLTSQDPTGRLPRYAPLRLETMVLTSSPFVLPAIVLILIASVSTGRQRG
jgi:hypothetical protein